MLANDLKNFALCFSDKKSIYEKYKDNWTNYFERIPGKNMINLSECPLETLLELLLIPYSSISYTIIYPRFYKSNLGL